MRYDKIVKIYCRHPGLIKDMLVLGCVDAIVSWLQLYTDHPKRTVPAPPASANCVLANMQCQDSGDSARGFETCSGVMYPCGVARGLAVQALKLLG